LFLDEIGDLNLNLQAKLLRVLQEKEVKRIGSNEVISLDVRIIVATHKELLKEVKNKNFREDLYYRIAGIPIAILPLRERKEDIALLAEYFLHVFSKEHNRNSQSFSAESMEKLKSHAWPGNVRELKSVIELSAIMCDTEIITPEHLHFSTLQTESDFLENDRTLAQYTQLIVKHHLKKNDNNVVETAKKLGIGKSTLYDMLKKNE
jgi:transcriptional regulator with PAS, ATPase and Fis domain